MAMQDEIRSFLKPGQEVRFLDLFPESRAGSASNIIWRANRDARRERCHDELYYINQAKHGKLDPIVGRYPVDVAIAATRSSKGHIRVPRAVAASRQVSTVNRKAKTRPSQPVNRRALMANLPSGAETERINLMPFADD